jgi:hypothetical protein
MIERVRLQDVTIFEDLGTISKLSFIRFDVDLEFPEPPVPQKPARQLHYPQVIGCLLFVAHQQASPSV